MLGWKPNMIYYLLLGRALDKPPKLLLVIPSKLDCLKLAIFLRLELKARLELNKFTRRFQEKYNKGNFKAGESFTEHLYT